jgi:hypothetical protein
MIGVYFPPFFAALKAQRTRITLYRRIGQPTNATQHPPRDAG